MPGLNANSALAKRETEIRRDLQMSCLSLRSRVDLITSIPNWETSVRLRRLHEAAERALHTLQAEVLS